jgi:hypothetical protein
MLLRRYLLLLVAAILLALSAVVHGLWTDRWATSEALRKGPAQLAALPEKLGDWEAQPLDIDPRQLARTEAVGHVARRYVHRRSGAEVSMIVLCGRPGPLSVHRPEICYAGQGYQTAADPEAWTAPVDDTTLWTARFVRPGADPAPLRVMWAWGTNGEWQAAKNPRREFALQPALFKLYVVRRLTRPDESLQRDPATDFVQQLVPALRRCLTEAPEAPPRLAQHLVAQAIP